MANGNLKERLAKGPVVGTWVNIPSPQLVSIIGKSGLDFAIFDMEHGPIDIKTLSEMVFAAHAECLGAVVRVAKNDDRLIQQALELGIDGILVPHISTAKDAESFVNAALYAPRGKRGFAPVGRAHGYDFCEGMTERLNQSVLRLALVEDREGIRNLKEIAENPGIDGVFFGACDLSADNGIPGNVGDSRVVNAIKAGIVEVQRQGKITGWVGGTKEDLDGLHALGVRFITIGSDTQMVIRFYKEVAERERGIINTSEMKKRELVQR